MRRGRGKVLSRAGHKSKRIGNKGSINIQNKAFHCQVCEIYVNSETQLKQVMALALLLPGEIFPFSVCPWKYQDIGIEESVMPVKGPPTGISTSGGVRHILPPDPFSTCLGVGLLTCIVPLETTLASPLPRTPHCRWHPAEPSSLKKRLKCLFAWTLQLLPCMGKDWSFQFLYVCRVTEQ